MEEKELLKKYDFNLIQKIFFTIFPKITYSIFAKGVKVGFNWYDI